MKTIKTAAMIVGAVALVASGVGAIAGGAAFAAATGVSLATATAIGTAAGIVGSIATALSQKKPTIQGSSTQFKADPQAGIPFMVGRTAHAGNIVHRDSWGDDNKWQGFVIVWSGGGPSYNIEKFQVDYADVTFADGQAVGTFNSWMWLHTQLGDCPSSVMDTPVGGFPGWGPTSGLSGYCAGIWVLRFDTKGKKYASGVPAPLMIGTGPMVYDPRLDDTYPGGSGACRALDEATYVPSENGPLHALTFALGRWQNDKRVFGVGMLQDQIEIEPFVDAANTSDANDWKCGGTIYSTDDKWAVLKSMMQTVAGEPMHLGAKLSCHFSSPKVSIATITEKDLRGNIQFVGTQSRRERKNGCIPRIRSEPHGWQVIPLDPIIVDEYVAIDRGRLRMEEFDISLCQQPNQGAQLGTYRLANSRELGPISFPVGPMWIGLRPGDCVTLNFPSIGLINRKVILRRRKLNPSDTSVTFVAVTETDSKHPFALGKEGVTPPVPDLGVPEPSDPSLESPDLAALKIINSFPIFTAEQLCVSAGADCTLSIDAHERRYPDKDVSVMGGEIDGLAFDSVYYIYYDDISREGGEVMYHFTDYSEDARNSSTNLGRHYVGQITTPEDSMADPTALLSAFLES